MIKNNLLKYRIYNNKKQNELCKLLNLSIYTYRKIETHYHYPKYQIRYKICNYFNVSQNQMFYEEEEEEE